MGYPSSVSGCGCDSGDSVASSGITGTAGCSGLNVPCIAFTNGIATSLTDRTLSIPTQEVCPSDLCQEGASTNDVLVWNGTQYAPAAPSTVFSGRTAEFCFYDSVGFSGNINLANDEFPAPDPTDWTFFRCAFVPTDFAVYCWSVNCENAGAQFGYQLQWSTDLTTWTSAAGVLDLDNTTAEPVELVGTFSIPGNPSVVYLRLIYINKTGNDRVISIRNLQISAWN